MTSVFLKKRGRAGNGQAEKYLDCPVQNDNILREFITQEQKKICQCTHEGDPGRFSSTNSKSKTNKTPPAEVRPEAFCHA